MAVENEITGLHLYSRQTETIDFLQTSIPYIFFCLVNCMSLLSPLFSAQSTFYYVMCVTTVEECLKVINLAFY
jgi:hypothetical protein